jgi:GTP-binding protein HflX
VIDAAHPNFADQMEVADRTLHLIKEDSVKTFYVFNKIDAIDKDTITGLKSRYPDAVFISAAKQVGLDDLKRRIEEEAFGRNLEVEVRVRAIDGKGISQVKSLLQGPTSALENGYCVMTGHIESRLMNRLERLEGVRVRYLF